MDPLHLAPSCILEISTRLVTNTSRGRFFVGCGVVVFVVGFGFLFLCFLFGAFVLL